MDPVLNIAGLTKKFDECLAVDHLNFEIKEGSFFSILGPSGCGKTTLLRMIAGFTEPTSGTIQIRGKDMVGISPNRRPVNLVFQNLALFPMMNVEQNIAFGLRRRRLSTKEIGSRVGSMLERVELSGFGKKRIDQLSGGQKQRVAIARSLVLEPSLLLLDEPLGALDLKLREQMKVELKKLQAQVGTTFMYITHDQSEALVMSDTVGVMQAGRFEQIDTPQNLYTNPATCFVAGFVGESNILDAKIEQDHHRLTIRTAGGQCLQAVRMHNFSGNACRVYIRPESILIKPDMSVRDLNRFELKVKTILFDGSNTKLLASFGTTEVTVALPQNNLFDRILPGDTIQAGVHAENCRCYRAGQP